MSNLFIIPEKTHNLMKVFKNTENKWQPWTRTHVLQGITWDQVIPEKYQEWQNAFEENSIYYKDLGNDNNNPYGAHSFEATIVVGAFANAVIGFDNSEGLTPVTVGYNKSTGLESHSSLEVGVSFNLGVEFGTGLAKVHSELGFNVTASMSETISELQTRELDMTVAPGDSSYIYQLAYKLVRVKGRIQKYPGGKWVCVVGGEGSMTDYSPIFKLQHNPL